MVIDNTVKIHKGLVTNYGKGGLQNERGGHVNRGGGGHFLTMLKGGGYRTSCWDSFYAVA